MPNNRIPQQAILVETPIPRVFEGNANQNVPEVVLVHRNKDADQVVRNAQQNNFVGKNNITNVVENFFAQIDLNVGLHWPKFVFALSNYILHNELPRVWKILKIINFVGDANESIVEHVEVLVRGGRHSQ